jgi:hypothetical protein
VSAAPHDEQAVIPPWLAPIERLVAHAAREIQVLAALTPVDAHRERVRLVEALRAGRAPSPRWSYAPVSHTELRRALDAAERALERTADTPLERLHLDRVRELAVEGALCAAAGTGDVARLARARFAPPAAGVVHAAAALCASWLGDPAPAPGSDLLASDDPDPRSLLSRMRAAVGELRLPFVVVAQPTLAPLAATGERAILVASGRLVRDEDAVRTVLHEIDGHARPRARSLTAPLALFRAGTARGVDHQEGRALLLEERAGLLGPHRRRQLAARHRAVEAMHAGATFHDVASTLTREHGLDASDAVVIAERAFRGGDGSRPGLGRERVYLEGLVHVRERLAERPGDEHVLAAGQVATDAVDALRPYAPPA